MLEKPFRVLIAGGSIAGLTLAHALDRAGIDYLVLEANECIAPQVGAGIGLMPNGLRVLDQLGICEHVEKLIQPLDVYYNRMPGGKIFGSFRMGENILERHGYPVSFLDRQKVLQILYDHLPSKRKVLVNKRVIKAQSDSQGIQVKTKDGSIYEGDLLIGADGVHSSVRQEMWRIADEIQPGLIPDAEKTKTFSDYSCIFGISSTAPGMTAGEAHACYNNHFSFLVFNSLGGRVHWFVFFKNRTRYQAPNIPRYSRRDAEEVAQQYLDHNITPTVAFGEIWNTRLFVSLTALEEGVFERWHFGRIALVGDSAHKMTPSIAQGGNIAIESSAALANSLNKALTNSASGTLSSNQISTLLAEYQNNILDRAHSIELKAGIVTRIHAWDGLWTKVLSRIIVPALGTRWDLEQHRKLLIGAVRLDYLDVPVRKRLVPFEDEVCSGHIRRVWVSKLPLVVIPAFSWAAHAVLRLLEKPGVCDSWLYTYGWFKKMWLDHCNAKIFSAT